MDGGRRRRLLDWAAVVAGAVVASVVLGLLQVPSAALFGGLLAAVVRALAGRRHLRVPRPAMTAAQAVIGVSIGALIDVDTLATIGSDWLPVLLVTLGTLILSVLNAELDKLEPDGSELREAFDEWVKREITLMEQDPARAAEIGANRFLELVRQYGRDTVTGASEDLMDYSERLMRAAIREACAAAGAPTRAGSDVGSSRCECDGQYSRPGSGVRWQALPLRVVARQRALASLARAYSCWMCTFASSSVRSIAKYTRACCESGKRWRISSNRLRVGRVK